VLGYRSLGDYVRERLGISSRKAWALLRVERAARRAPAFSAAYRCGALSWLRALTLVPVLTPTYEAPWVARAREVTLRCLADDVERARDLRDVSGGRAGFEPPARPVTPPPSATMNETGDVTTDGVHVGAAAPVTFCGIDDAVHSGAHGKATTPVNDDAVPPSVGGAAENTPRVDFASQVADGEIRFTGPASVIALFRCALRAYGHDGEPRWRALERMLAEAVREWEREARHWRHPILDRDGWRCVVPACSARAPLHQHHVRFRSQGGGDEPENLASVCVPHHQYGIHLGRVRGCGTAPANLRWQLGLRTGAPPLMELVGDRYVAGNP
jgi:hypothetical protein